MPYVKRIKSNLKGGIDATLGPKTLVVGRNSTGKTALVASLELALTSKVTTRDGRGEAAREQDLIKHASGDRTELWAEAVTDDGHTHAFRTTAAGSRGAKKALVEGCGGFFPLRELRDGVLKSDEKARKYLLTKVAGGVTLEQLTAGIPSQLQEYFEAALSEGRGDETPAEALLSAWEVAKKKVREAHEEAKALEEVQRQAAEGLAPAVPDLILKEAHQRVLVARAALEAHSQAAGEYLAWQRTQAQQGSLQQDLVTQSRALALAQEELRGLRLDSASAKAYLDSLPVPVAPPVAARALVAVLEAAQGASACPACKCEGLPEGYLAEQLALAREAMSGGKAAFEAATHERARAEANRASIVARGKALAERVRLLEQAVRILESVPSSAAAPPLAAVDLAPLREEQANAETALRQLEATAASWGRVRTAKERLLVAQARKKSWEQVVEACGTAVGEVLDQGVAKLNARVQLRLPAGSPTFQLRLRDGAATVCELGLLDPVTGLLNTELAGAEWARVTVALADALAEGQEGLHVLVPDDRAFDPITLAEVLVALGKATCQVVVTSPVRPAQIPAGWVVIDTDARQHRAPLPMVTAQGPVGVGGAAPQSSVAGATDAAVVSTKKPRAARGPRKPKESPAGG